MDRSKQTMRTILSLTLLVLPLLGIHAFTGTLTRWDAKMQYSIEGGTVTHKTEPHSANFNSIDCTVLVEGTVKPGSTLNASIKKLAGITLPKERSGNLNKVMIQYQIYTGSGVKPISKKVEHATATSLSIPVPDNASKVYVRLTYYTPHNRLICDSEWKVNGTTTTTNSTSTTTASDDIVVHLSNGKNISLHYSISGGWFKKKSSGTDYVTYGGSITHGESITASGESKDGWIYVDFEFKDKYGKEIKTNYNRDGSVTASAHAVVPSNAEWAVCRVYWGALRAEVEYRCWPPSTSPSPTADNFKWNDVAEDNVCKACSARFYNHFVTSIKGKPKKVCAKLNRIITYENTDMDLVAKLYDRIFPYDQIVTDENSMLTIQWGDEEESTIGIYPYSSVKFDGFVNGRVLWRVFKGTIAGENLRRVSDKSGKPVFLLSNCSASLSGTTYVIQDDGKHSTIYLLDGSIEVTNNAKKTYKLKPGEVSTVAKDGKISVKKFDVKAMARKYGLGTSTTTTTTTNEKHYALQRASVKYKYTKGSQTGEVVRRFDGYGVYERVDSKVGTTINVTICRGAKSYRLDVAKKTAHESAYAPIYFLSETDVKKHGLKKKGTATIAGKPCTVYASAKEEYYVWNGITLKRVVNEGGTKTVVEAYAVEQPATMDESLFKLPQGYQVK